MSNFYEINTQEHSILCLTKSDFNSALRHLKEEGTKVLSLKTIYPTKGVNMVPPPEEDEFQDFI